MTPLDLSAWHSEEEPEFTTEATVEDQTIASTLEEINEDLIKSAIEKAKTDMSERARFEYEVWLNSAYFETDISMNGKTSFSTKKKYSKTKLFQFSKLGGGIDARSPDGTAASFSKANRNSLKIANSSLFFEFATNEIINSLQK